MPFRRSRLIFSALVIGTFAPDFEYFFLLGEIGKFGHTLRGAFLFDLPMSFAVFWLFHLIIEQPIVQLLPDVFRLRLQPKPGRFRFTDPRTQLIVCISALFGILTHIAWDSFTHPDTWPYRHIALLRETFRVPVLHALPGEKIMQFASTVVGAAFVVAAIIAWVHRTPPRAAGASHAMPPSRRTLILASFAAVAYAIALGRAAYRSAIPAGHHALFVYAGKATVTSFSIFFGLLIVYGLFARARRPE